MITFTEVAALAVAVELIATILKQRAPGMTLNRMPLFLWAMLVTQLHDHLRDAGGDARLVLPDLGPAGRHPILQSGRGRRRAAVAAPVLVLRPPRGLHHLPAGDSASSARSPRRSPAPGLRLSADGAGAVSIGLLAFGLWVHHMFATGLPRLGYSFYTAASMMIALPAGVQIFCWIATIWDGKPRLGDAAAVGDRLHRHLRDGRPDRGDAGERAARPAAPRHLFRRRPFPLRADRRRGLPAARRDLPTGSQIHRPH
jgi:cytochrome c oxidase subunit I+III